MREYTFAATGAVLIVVLVELSWLRTGIFRQRAYWASIAIVVCFQAIVDGWLTKLSAPIVLYAGRDITGLRVPWDIPIEDFGFGFAMVTLTMMLWDHVGVRDAAALPAPSSPSRDAALEPGE